MLTWLTVVSCGLQLVPGRLEPTSIIFRKSSEEGAVRRAGSFLKTNNMLHCIWKLDIFTPDLFLARPFSHFGHKAWQIGTRGKSPPQQEGDGDLSCWTCIRTDMVWVINVGDKILLFFLQGRWLCSSLLASPHDWDQIWSGTRRSDPLTLCQPSNVQYYWGINCDVVMNCQICIIARLKVAFITIVNYSTWPPRVSMWGLNCFKSAPFSTCSAGSPGYCIHCIFAIFNLI